MARIRELEEGTAPENFQQEQEAQPNDLAAMEAVIDKILGTREKKMNAAHFIDVCERNYDGMSTDSWGDYIHTEGEAFIVFERVESNIGRPESEEHEVAWRKLVEAVDMAIAYQWDHTHKAMVHNAFLHYRIIRQHGSLAPIMLKHLSANKTDDMGSALAICAKKAADEKAKTTNANKVAFRGRRSRWTRRSRRRAR